MEDSSSTIPLAGAEMRAEEEGGGEEPRVRVGRDERIDAKRRLRQLWRHLLGRHRHLPAHVRVAVDAQSFLICVRHKKLVINFSRLKNQVYHSTSFAYITEM